MYNLEPCFCNHIGEPKPKDWGILLFPLAMVYREFYFVVTVTNECLEQVNLENGQKVSWINTPLHNLQPSIICFHFNFSCSNNYWHHKYMHNLVNERNGWVSVATVYARLPGGPTAHMLRIVSLTACIVIHRNLNITHFNIRFMYNSQNVKTGLLKKLKL